MVGFLKVKTQTFSDCPTILISGYPGLCRFYLKIPNPFQCAVTIGKTSISTRVVIFLSNPHKRKRNAEYLILMSRETQKLRSNCRRLLTEIIVLEHQKWHFRASRFKTFLGKGGGGLMPPDRPSNRRLQLEVGQSAFSTYCYI